MPDFRVHCQALPEDQEILLRPEESHHLVVVNRARKDDPVTAFDGHGQEWNCTLAVEKKQAAVLKVLSTKKARPLPYEITLGQALPKGPCMDSIIRKATEIGARRIVPLQTERTQVKLEGDRQDRKSEKWEMASLEAAKQCGNPWLPEILPLSSLEQALSDDYDLKLVASLHPGAVGLKQVLSEYRQANGAAPEKVLCLVGPEGDFTAAEMRLMMARDVRPITLGPLVLRCETAAVYVLSILSHELGQAD